MPLNAQQLTGPELLEQAIAYHDPNGSWPTFIANFEVTMTSPGRSDRVSQLDINLPGESFELIAVRDSLLTEYRISPNDASVVKINLKSPDSSIQITDQDRKRIFLMRDYYTYLYGLPMKLKDPGTQITEKVVRRSFKGKSYDVLEVSYEKEVGSDLWYFYFDPKSHRMEIYQFFKRDQDGQPIPDSGEYILLSEESKIGGINMPKIRKWYYNKNDAFLGTDSITRE